MHIIGERRDGAVLVDIGGGQFVVADQQARTTTRAFDIVTLNNLLNVSEFSNTASALQLHRVRQMMTSARVLPVEHFQLMRETKDGEPWSDVAKRAWDTRGRSEGKESKPSPRPGFTKVLETISKPDGGFTYQPATDESPTSGYALSIYKGRERVFDVAKLTLNDLWEHAQDNWDLLSKPGNYIGGWHNPEDGKAYLDVSMVVKDKAEAERMGRENNQLAYFDLGKGESVKL